MHDDVLPLWQEVADYVNIVKNIYRTKRATARNKKASGFLFATADDADRDRRWCR